MPPKRRNRVGPAPASVEPQLLPLDTDMPGPPLLPIPPPPGPALLPIPPPRRRRNVTPASTLPAEPVPTPTPTAPPRRGRKRPSATATQTAPTQKRRRLPSSTVTSATANEPDQTAPAQEYDILSHPAVPSVGEIADAVYHRLKQARMFESMMPTPNPQPTPSVHYDSPPPVFEDASPDMGMPFQNNDFTPSSNQSLISQSLPLGYNVPEKTKQSIWGDQYVDLGQLAPGLSQPTETVLYQSPDSSFKIATGLKPSKQISTIHQWNNCFDIFMSIYLTKFNDRVLQLLKYANIIRNMSAKLGFEPARYYDEEFRKLKASHGLNWSVIHDELWRMATAMQFRRPIYAEQRPQQPFRRDSQPELIPGFCWRFARTGKCTIPTCNMRHGCCFCGKRHANGACRRPQYKTPNANPSRSAGGLPQQLPKK